MKTNTPHKHTLWWSLFCSDEQPNEMAGMCFKGRVSGVIRVIKVNACRLHCLPFVPPTQLVGASFASRPQGGARRGRGTAFDASHIFHQQRGSGLTLSARVSK